MLKTTLSYLLLFSILLQTFSKLIVIADYQLHKNYIAAVLCENRSKPQMKCNGKCHLKKQLAKEDKKESAPQNNLKEKIELQFFSEAAAVSFVEFCTQNKPVPYTDTLIPRVSLNAVFHPPTV